MTKAEAITAKVKERIKAGEWTAGDALPSRGQWAAQYGVSPATITAAIRQLQKEGLVVVLQGKGAFLAQPQEAGARPQPAIGLTGSYLAFAQEEPWYEQAILGGIWQEANRCHRPVVLLPQLAMSPHLTRDYCSRLGIAGLIFLGGEGHANARQLKAEGFPVILSNKPAEPTALSYLDYDNAFVIRETVRLLASAGHRRIGVFCPKGSVRNYDQEIKLHFLDALMQYGLAHDVSAYWHSVSREGGNEGDFPQIHNAAARMLDLPEPPTAFFCWEPRMLPMLTQVLHKRRLRVPQDISLIVSSYGSDAQMEHSGFVVPHRELGAALVSGLCQIIANPHHAVQQLLRPRYISGDTVATPDAG